MNEAIEKAAVALGNDVPAAGCARASNELRKKGVSVSPFGVRSIWIRHGMETYKNGYMRIQPEGVSPSS